MNLPKRLIAEPTTFFTYDGRHIPLSTLPENISQEFAVLDKMRQEMADLTYNLETLTFAIKGKSGHLNSLINQHLSKNKSRIDNKKQDDTNDNEDAIS